jgi:DNA-binding CsgD family transcriptional regulator
MRQGRRYGLSAEQRTDIWRRWKAGESLHEIGRAFGKDHGSIQFLLSQHGGIVPAVRRRSPRTLTLTEREEISRGLASGSSIREIARGLKRTASTVSWEVARHGGVHCIGPVEPIIRPGSRLCGPGRVFLLSTGSCGRSLPIN